MEECHLKVLYEDGDTYLYITGFEEDILIPLPGDYIGALIEALNEAMKLAAIDAGLAELGMAPTGEVGES